MSHASDFVCVVTGASRGLGEALSIAAAKGGGAVVLIGRDAQSLQAMGTRCKELGAPAVSLIAADLGSALGVNDVCSSLNERLFTEYRKVVLFNNASTIDPIESFAELSFDDIDGVLRLNVSAALALSSTIVRLSSVHTQGETYVVNISSGASINPVVGWSPYCISKAALNMVTKCVAIETVSAQRPVYSWSINPGPLDTRMQERIRSADKKKSPAAEKFSNMFSAGKLKKPEDVAAKIFAILDSKQFANGDYIDFNLLSAS